MAEIVDTCQRHRRTTDAGFAAVLTAIVISVDVDHARNTGGSQFTKVVFDSADVRGQNDIR